MNCNSKESVQQHNLNRLQATTRWLDGIPTGNGFMGAMTWGGPDEMIITLDRSDLWLTNGSYKADFTPVNKLRRLCAGSLHVMTPSCASCFQEGLDLFEATAFRKVDKGMDRWQWMIHATRPLLCIQIPAALPEVRFNWHAPRLYDHRETDSKKYQNALHQGNGEENLTNPYEDLLSTTCDITENALVTTISYDNHPLGMIMATAFQDGEVLPLISEDGFYKAEKHAGKPALLLLTIGCLRQEPAATVDQLRKILLNCPDWNSLNAEHCDWWSDFWGRSGMSLSHQSMDRQWHLGNYFLGCNSRKDSPTIPLQGVWSEDGSVPWGNRLGWDLNIQATYSSIYTGNHLEMGFSLYDWILNNLPRMKEFAKIVFGDKAEGAYLYPGCDDMCNTWVNHSCGGIGAGGWISHHFWQHFLYSNDLEFLRNYCLPVFTEFLKCQRFVWYKGKDGRYHLDQAESPEIHALSTLEHPISDTTYEISMAKNLGENYLTMLHLLKMPLNEPLALWALDFNANVVDYPTSSGAYQFSPIEPTVTDYFIEWPGFDTDVSHRHLSHMLMIHPLGEIHRFSDHDILWRARNTVCRMLERGMYKWMGYTFPWASLMCTRLSGFPKMPSFMLELQNQFYANPFNGLVVGEDAHGSGIASPGVGAYCPQHPGTWTIEANMFSVTAIQDALVHTAGGHTVIGGGVSPDCDGEFWNLRSASGELVSGIIEKGQIVSVEIHQERKGKSVIAIPSNDIHFQDVYGKSKPTSKAGHVIFTTSSEPGGVARFEQK